MAAIHDLRNIVYIFDRTDYDFKKRIRTIERSFSFFPSPRL